MYITVICVIQAFIAKPTPTLLVAISYKSEIEIPIESLDFRSIHENESEEEIDHERISLLNQAENVIKEQFLEEFHKTKAELQTLHSTNKDLLDGQEDIGTIEAEVDAKLVQLDNCLSDLNLEKDKLEVAIRAIDELNPEAMNSDKGVIDTREPVHGQILACFAQDAALSDGK